MTEKALCIPCAGEQLVGVFHAPERAAGSAAQRAILMVVGGGPQYRGGGHRQLLLWARQLARHGYPVLRFDYRGMGDSSGTFGGFTTIDEDLRAAIDRLLVEAPDAREVILWGECDASAAILSYAYRDPRIKGLTLQNVWVQTEAGQADAILRSYYWQRLLQPSFWRKVFRFEYNPVRTAREALSYARKAIAGRRERARAERAVVATSFSSVLQQPLPAGLSLPERLLEGLRRFKGPVLLTLSGRDIVAQEFALLIKSSPAWQATLAAKPATRHDMPLADHTFSSAPQRNEVLQRSLDWLASLP